MSETVLPMRRDFYRILTLGKIEAPILSQIKKKWYLKISNQSLFTLNDHISGHKTKES